jgi:hypothetical protein
MVSKRTENPVDQFSVINQNLERLSTQTEFESLELREASELAFLLLGLQNTGAASKHKAARRAGELFNEIEGKGGSKALKKRLIELENLGVTIPSKFTRKWRKEAQVSEKDFENHLTEILKKSKELTDSSIMRAGKERQPTLLSTAGKILKGLSSWQDSKYIKSVCKKEYVGTPEEIQQVSKLLKNLAVQFLAAAKIIDM